MLHSLDQFGRACYSGASERALAVRSKVSCRTLSREADGLQLLTSESDPPDLTRRQEPMGYTYATLAVLGYVGRVGTNDRTEEDYVDMLHVLLSAGVPVDGRDVLGMTALHHAAHRTGNCGLAKVFLKHKADVNLQDRFGASPLSTAIEKRTVDIIPVLLDAVSGLDVTDGEGSSPSPIYPTRPARVSDVVKDWFAKREGKGSVPQGDRCSKCGTGRTSVKRCARCRSQLYCSPECQSKFIRANTMMSHHS